MTAASGAMNRWPQKTTSMGRCARAAQSAASENASLPCTGGSCRTPEGSVPSGVARARGRTITSPIRSHVASEDRKSRLYWAIPPRPPNASVTSARTRSEGSTITFPLRPPPPERPSAAPRGISGPQAREPVATAGCAYRAAATHGSEL